MRLLDWLLGRGRNPLEVPDERDGRADRPRVETTPHVRTPEHRPAREVDPSVAAAEARSDADEDVALRAQANTLGVTPDVMRRMLSERAVLVAEVAQDPRAWGFDLLRPGAERRDLAAEYRRRVRLTGSLGDSFLGWFEPLMALVPDPPTLPDGTPLDQHLARHARLEPEAARDIAHHVRTTLQATLGAPLDADAVEHAVREASWDHDFDVARVLPQVLHAMGDVL